MRNFSIFLLSIAVLLVVLPGSAFAAGATPAESQSNPVGGCAVCLMLLAFGAFIFYLMNGSKRKAEKAALAAVRKAREERDTARLVGLLSSKYLHVSLEAATALEEAGEAAIEPLLVHLPSQGQYKISAMRTAVKPMSITVGSTGANTEVAVDLGPGMVPALIKCLGLPKNSTYYGAITLLKDFGSGSVAPLIDALIDPDPNVRAAVAALLGDLSDGRAIEPLIAALRDADKEVRLEAVRALDKFDDARTIEPLKRALKDPSSDVQAAAASALGDFSSELTGLPPRKEEPEDYSYEEEEKDAEAKQSASAPALEREIIREVVKVPCRYCGTLVDITKSHCPSCSAPFKI